MSLIEIGILNSENCDLSTDVIELARGIFDGRVHVSDEVMALIMKQIASEEDGSKAVFVGIKDDLDIRRTIRDLAYYGYLPKKYTKYCSILSEEQLLIILKEFKNGTLTGPSYKVQDSTSTGMITNRRTENEDKPLSESQKVETRTENDMIPEFQTPKENCVSKTEGQKNNQTSDEWVDKKKEG